MVTQSKDKPALNIENLGRGGWLIQHIDVAKWGTEVVVQAIFDPDLPDTTQFKLVFSKCSTLVWDTEENEYDERDLKADVIGFDIDDEVKDNKAIITADIFSLAMTYQELIIQKS